MSYSQKFFGDGNRRGITSMVAATVFLVANDVLIKLTSERIPIGQVIVVRGLFATALICMLALANGHLRSAAALLDRTVLLRSLFDVVASVCFLTALANMQIGNVTAITMASPLVMTAIAAVFTIERVGWRRWTAVALGFGGILMIVQPRADAFSGWSLVALTSMCFIVMRDLVTRRLDAAIPSMIVVLANTAMIVVGASALIPFQGWVPMTGIEYLQLAGAAVFVLSGYQLIIDSMRHGEMSLVVPFRYSALVWAILAGLLVWGDLPNPLAFSGICVIVASSLYILHRERVRRLEAERP